MPIIREFTSEDAILIFDSNLDDRSSYEPHHLEALRSAEESHFWFLSRREKICQFFQKYVEKSSSILEIGGGTGFVAETLINLGFSIEMADIHQNGLRFAQKRGLQKLYQFDLFKPPFQQEYDVICLFDVLERLKDAVHALECIKSMLKPGGIIILTVPAHQWLWSRDDVIAGHEKRYIKKEVEQTFLSAEIKPVQIQYFFSSIIPLLLLRKLIKKDNQEALQQNETVDFAIHPFINQSLYYLTKAELSIAKFFPNIIGGSLIAVGQI